MKGRTIGRRTFLAASATGSVFTVVSRDVLGGTAYTAPSDKLNIAGIGIGGMGASNLHNCRKENIVALCDVDHKYAERTLARYPDAKQYRDYRDMFADRHVPMRSTRVATCPGKAALS